MDLGISLNHIASWIVAKITKYFKCVSEIRYTTKNK